MKTPSVDIKRAVHRLKIDPFLDWFLIVIMTAVMIVILAAVGASVYLDVGARLSAPLPSAGTGTKSVLDANALSNVLSSFDSHTAEWQSIIHGYSIPRDPSLP